MNYEIVTLSEKILVGLRVCTSNSDPKIGETIDGLWGNFYAGGMHAQIKHKISERSICLYSDYEQGGADIRTEKYCVSVGCEVSKAENEDFSVKLIPSARYAKFSVQGNMHVAVAEAWQKIWQLPLERTFTGDFEEYLTVDFASGNAEVDIYVAVR